MSSRPHLPCLQAAKPLVQHLRSLLYFSLVIFSFSQFPLPPSSRIRSLILVSFITHPFDSFSLYQGQKNQTEERRGEGRGRPQRPPTPETALPQGRASIQPAHNTLCDDKTSPPRAPSRDAEDTPASVLPPSDAGPVDEDS